MAWLKSVWNCFSWIFYVIWKEFLVDLHFNDIPWHPNDFLWYAERWNGRVAMVTILVVLQLELIYKTSIWDLIGVL